MERQRLGEVLVERGALSQDQLDEVLERENSPGRLGESLVLEGVLSKADVGAALESVTGVPYVECPPSQIDPRALTKISAELARRCAALPLLIEGNTLVVAMAEPQNVAHVKELEFGAGMAISARFSFKNDIVNAIRKFYGSPVPAATAVPRQPAVRLPAETQARGGNWRSRGILVGVFGLIAIGGWVLGDSWGRDDPSDQIDAPVVSSPTTTAEGTEPKIDAAEVVEPEIEDGESPEIPLGPVPRSLAETPSPARTTAFTIQVGVFRNQVNAERLVRELEAKHEGVRLSVSPAGLYTVEIGAITEKEMADRIVQEIRDATGLVAMVRRSRSRL